MKLTTGSFCTGIAAPELAWRELGWTPKWFSEIEPFACALLAHRFPDVPNLGDMTKIKGEDLERVDLICAGTPCQSFSVAGLRKGLDDPRGNLALVFLGHVDKIRPRWVVWENVPGVLSSWSDDETFAASEESGGIIGEALAAGTEAGLDAGPVYGPRDFEEVTQSNDFDTFLCGLRELGYGVAWRIFDAQFFGVPQRRRRVFVVGYLGDWRPAAAVLFERHGLSGNPPPSREAGTRVAVGLTCGAGSGGNGGYAGRRREDDSNIVNCLDAHMGMGGPDDNAAQAGHLIPEVAGCLSDGAHTGGGSTDRTHIPGELSRCLNAGGMGRQDFETETLIPVIGGFFSEPTHSLRADGFDGSEDGTGRGTPIVPVAIQEDGQNGVCIRDTAGSLRSDAPGHQPCGTLIGQSIIPIDMRQASRGATMTNNRTDGGAPGTGIGEEGDPAPSLSISHTPAIAFQERGRADGRNVESQTDLAYSLNAPSGGGRRQELNVATPLMAVRRLTPLECERLMNLPDNYTLIPYNGKPAKDGPRYKACGNSIVVACMRWIGNRINQVEEILKSESARAAP